jgi:prevent-host-death family protein
MIILFYKGQAMRSDISATDAVRHFSELLNNIKYRGDRYMIIRGGKPAAALVPAEELSSVRRMGDLNEIFQMLPRLDPNDRNFADDVLEAISAQPPLPGDMTWE